MDIARLLNLQSMASNHVDADPLFQAEDAQSRPDTAIPDTLPWENLFQADPGECEALPPIPSQCSILPTQPNSVASSSQSRYLKPFAGKGLHTLSVVEEPVDEAGDAQATSAPANEDYGHARPALVDMEVSAEKWQELSNTVNSHEHRLERLENASISVIGHDDCYEKVDSIDCRVVDLTERLEEVEKIVKDNSSTTTASVVSVETDATVLGPNRGAIYTRLQSLEAQVSKLQSSLPTYNNPWRLEVIFLPYPLKGVWIEGREWPNQRSSTGTNGDEWTQMPNTMSRATPDPHEWHGQFADSNWMFPKAFVAGKTIDKRLRSRGLVQTIEVRGSDARSVNIAIEKAFGDIFRISIGNSGQCYRSDVSVFLGLQHAWVPLRKLHKDSRLRFLARSEMTTPSLWDYNFLCASVVMKASGTPRLYITQPEAYLQDHPQGLAALESGWTWNKVRQLDRVWPDSQSSVDAFVPEGDAREECWAEDSHLDAPPSANSSALSLRHHRQRRVSTRGPSVTPSEQFYTGVQSLIPSNSALFGRAQSPLTQREHYGSRPHNVRTSSLPHAVGGIPSPSQSRRRFSAHISTATPYERRSSPLITRPSPRMQAQNYIASPITTGPSASVYKRRFASREPSLQPRSNTPRCSRTSMSRSPSLAPEGFHGFPNNRERHTTPFYATPFSEPSRYTQRGSSRPPAPPRPSDGYDPDDEEMTDDFGYDQSSSSDGQYDNEMGSDSSGSTSHPHQNDSQEIAVYQDNVDELDDVDTDPGFDLPSWSRFEPPLQESQPQNVLPQDIPWPGFEDEDHMSDGENVDPESGSGSQSQEIIIHEDEDVDLLDRQDDDGDVSGPDSQAPSEYSSKPGAWPAALASVSASVSAAGRVGVPVTQQESQAVQIYEDESGPETRWA